VSGAARRGATRRDARAAAANISASVVRRMVSLLSRSVAVLGRVLCSRDGLRYDAYGASRVDAQSMPRPRTATKSLPG
jgi:hypothetical protein